MINLDIIEAKHDLDKAVFYYKECSKYCECDDCVKINTDEEE